MPYVRGHTKILQKMICRPSVSAKKESKNTYQKDFLWNTVYRTFKICQRILSIEGHGMEGLTSAVDHPIHILLYPSNWHTVHFLIGSRGCHMKHLVWWKASLDGEIWVPQRNEWRTNACTSKDQYTFWNFDQVDSIVYGIVLGKLLAHLKPGWIASDHGFTRFVVPCSHSRESATRRKYRRVAGCLLWSSSHWGR